MFRLDENMLTELGLGELPSKEKNAMLRHIYETLELRVGMRLAENMNKEQLSDFDSLMPREADTPDERKQKEQQALKWLEGSFPNYRQIVGEELENLKTEIKQSAPAIIANSKSTIE